MKTAEHQTQTSGASLYPPNTGTVNTGTTVISMNDVDKSPNTRKRKTLLNSIESPALFNELIKRGVSFVVASENVVEDHVTDTALTVAGNLRDVCRGTAQEMRKSPVSRLKLVTGILVVLLNLAVLSLAIWEVTEEYSPRKLASVVMNCAAVSLVALTYCIPTYFIKHQSKKSDPNCSGNEMYRTILPLESRVDDTHCCHCQHNVKKTDGTNKGFADEMAAAFASGA